MKIAFAYTVSPKVKWSVDYFIELNERINKTIANYNADLNDKVKTLYVGILYLNDQQFDQIKARRFRTSLTKQSASMEIKIPLNLIIWDDLERLILSDIINVISNMINKKYIKNNEIIGLLQRLNP